MPAPVLFHRDHRFSFVAFAVVVLVLAVVPLRHRPPRATGPSIILISIDTLRADHLGAYGYHRQTSPFIDSIARQGTVFEDVVVPLPATDPSHSALLTGLHPLRTGMVVNASVLPDSFESFPEVLNANGYRTAAVTSVYHLAPIYGFGQGFEQFDSVAPERARRSADEVNADAIRVLRRYRHGAERRPLFMFVHYFDVHAPYTNHETSEPMPAVPSREWMVDAYDSGVRFVDAHLRELWNEVQAAHLPGGVILAITADHGEQLGEHGYLGGHADIYEETIHVPLVLAGPGIPHQRIAGAVSSMDLAPTLLDQAHLRFTKEIDGESLEPILRGAPVNARRPLLVMGYSVYARSIAVRLGFGYFLRNLEWVYRNVHIASDAEPAAPRPGEVIAASSTQNHVRRFSIPPIDFRPFGVTARLRAPIGCRYHVTVSFPGDAELVHDAVVDGSVSIDYSVARLDSTVIEVQPSECVEGATWTLTARSLAVPPKEPAPGAGNSYLYSLLLTARKDTVADERYDLKTDRHMMHDLVDDDTDPDLGVWRGLAQRTFEDLSGVDGQIEFSPEERQRLKALGYISR